MIRGWISCCSVPRSAHPGYRPQTFLRSPEHLLIGPLEQHLELSPSTCLPPNIGASLYLERKRRTLIIVNNRTDVPFITGDQPAINLKGTRPLPPDRLSIFHSIAPQAGLLMADVDEEPLFPAEGLTRNQAMTLNQMLFQGSYKQVFGRSEECLRAIAGMS